MSGLPALLRKLTLRNMVDEDYRVELEMLRSEFMCLSALEELEIPRLSSQQVQDELEDECKARKVMAIWRD